MAGKRTMDFNRILLELLGDEEKAIPAFKELVENVAPTIYYSAKKILKSKPIAEDLTQDVLTSIWEKRQNFSHVNNFELFIYGMTSKMAFEVIRKRINAEIVKKKHLEKLERQYDPFKEKYSQHLDELVEQLPSPRKQIFRLVKIDGIDGKVIAERFQISVNAVDHHVSRALKFIKERKHDVVSVTVLGIALIYRLIVF